MKFPKRRWFFMETTASCKVVMSGIHRWTSLCVDVSAPECPQAKPCRCLGNCGAFGAAVPRLAKGTSHQTPCGNISIPRGIPMLPRGGQTHRWRTGTRVAIPWAWGQGLQPPPRGVRWSTVHPPPSRARLAFITSSGPLPGDDLLQQHP